VIRFAYQNSESHVGGGAKHRAACSVAVGAMQVVSRSQRAPKFDLASIALTPTGGATAP
jgi:hypothetical protein